MHRQVLEYVILFLLIYETIMQDFLFALRILEGQNNQQAMSYRLVN